MNSGIKNVEKLICCTIYKYFIYFYASGFAFGVFSTRNSAKHVRRAFLVSPLTSVIAQSCLTFRYFLRSNLKLSITNSSATTTLVAFNTDGGFDFHQAFIDLPVGSYQLIWEVEMDQLEPVEIIRNYRAAVDGIDIGLNTCAQLSKSLKEATKPSQVFE